MNYILRSWYNSTVESWITDDIEETTPTPLKNRSVSAVRTAQQREHVRIGSSNGVEHIPPVPVIATFGGTPLHWIAMPALVSGVMLSKKYWPVEYRDLPM